MKRNYIKSILTLFTLAIILSGAALTASAQSQYRKALDFDGDNRANLTVIRPSNKIWYTRSTATGTLLTGNWGNGSLEFTVAGDYDGDGKTDIAVYRRSQINGEPQYFYILRSGSDYSFRFTQWGTAGDNQATIFPDYLTF